MRGFDVLDVQVGRPNGYAGPVAPALTAQSDSPFDFPEDVIDATPKFVAGLVLGAALTLFLLRVAGFRFSFGASVGGGS